LFGVLEFETDFKKSFGVLLRGSYEVDSQKTEAENLALLSLYNPLSNIKHLVVKKYPISSYSAAKKLPEIVEVKLSSCGLQKKLRLRNCRVVVAEQHFLKSCGIAITKALSASCGIAIADSKKSCACPPLSDIAGKADF
jgi:hypothetical protein